MSFRRFTDKPELDPTAVRGLPAGHPALTENRSLFPTTVITVTADEPDRLLVSGRNNRKLGETVEKGTFKGYALYGLSLEERATCPDDCSVRDVCYGNGMQLARRHRIGDADVFFDRLSVEIADLLDEHSGGLLIRLHVLGDFPSAEYVAFWADVLEENPKVACYGYTHRRTTAWGGDDIGDAIQSVKDRFPDRFRIRWSTEVSRPDGAVIVDYVPDKSRIDQGLVCPAQTDATACCATCGLCWEKTAAKDAIVFIKHGPKSMNTAAETAMLAKPPKPIERRLFNVDTADREELAERVRQIEEAVNDQSWVPSEWKLTSSEIAIVNAMLMRKIANKESIITLVYGGQVDDPPDEKIVDVFICKIRAKVAPWGVAIETVWGQGYRFTEHSRKIIEALKAGLPLPPMLEGSAFGAQVTRPIRPIPLPKNLRPAEINSDRPDVRLASPLDLHIEPAYQRDLSGKSIRLIRRIVANWDWAKFKPPICAETDAGLFVIDGQHTAIAAASHPRIVAIPVMVLPSDNIEARAAAFVAQNRDRVAMSVHQIFHAEVTAGDAKARAIQSIAESAGAAIPRSMPQRGRAKPGDVAAIVELKRILGHFGETILERVLRTAVMAERAPLQAVEARGLSRLFTDKAFAASARLPDSIIADAILRTPDLDASARLRAIETGCSRSEACADLIAAACEAFLAKEAA